MITAVRDSVLSGLIAKERDKRTKARANDMLQGLKRLVWLMENQPNPHSVYRALETNVPAIRDLISYCER